MTLAIRLDPELERRLTRLAHETHRTKTYYVSKALEAYLEDMEEVHIALERLASSDRRWSMEEVKRELKLDSGVGRQGSKSAKKTGSKRPKKDN